MREIKTGFYFQSRIKNMYAFAVILLIVFFNFVQPAKAFEISPAKALFTVDRDSSQTAVLKIKNTFTDTGQTGKNSLTFKLSVLGMTQDEKGKPVFSRGSDTAESWVYPENNLVEIKYGETKSVNFIIKIPSDAFPGDHYLGLAVEPVLGGSGQASLTTRLVSLLSLEVSGLVNESVSIEKWTLADKTDGHWKFDLGLKNSGTIEVLLQGSAVIRNWKGDEIFSEPIILGNKLLVGSKRAIQSEIVFKNAVILPGLYQAEVKINYGRTNQNVSSIAYVWYFPVWSRVVIGSAGLMLVLIVFLVIKNVKRR